MSEETCSPGADDLLIELAGRRFRFRGIPGGWDCLLPDRLLNCRVSGDRGNERTVEIRMTSDPDLFPPQGCHDLNQTSVQTFEAGRVRFSGDWCRGEFSVATADPVRIEIHHESRPWFGGVLENLARILMAYEVLAGGGVMLHCAALVRDRMATVLFGHSGAGKSTTSEIALANGYSVISDDINIIEPVERGWQVTPVPFSGTLNALSDINEPVPLGRVFRLRQDASDRVQPCSPAHAVSLLAGSAPFINQDPFRAQSLIEVLCRLVEDVPVGELYFTRGRKFLDAISSREGQDGHD